MTLPRFTSGRVGNLEFHHLNEAFDRIEQTDGISSSLDRVKQVWSRTILVRVVAHSGTSASSVASFVEVALASIGSSAYNEIVGGVTSTVNGNQYGAPIVGPLPPIGSVLAVVGHVAMDGKIYFKSAASPSSLSMLKIVGASSGTTNWRYDVRPVFWSGSAWIEDSTQAQAYGYNGAESIADIAATRTIGVGTIHPDTADATRKRLRDNLIVGPAMKQGDDWVFSIPNGYEFVCI